MLTWCLLKGQEVAHLIRKWGYQGFVPDMMIRLSQFHIPKGDLRMLGKWMWDNLAVHTRSPSHDPQESCPLYMLIPRLIPLAFTHQWPCSYYGYFFLGLEGFCFTSFVYKIRLLPCLLQPLEGQLLIPKPLYFMLFCTVHLASWTFIYWYSLKPIGERQTIHPHLVYMGWDGHYLAHLYLCWSAMCLLALIVLPLRIPLR